MSIQESAFDTPIRSAKQPEALGGEPAPARPHQRGHPRIVPAVDVTVGDQLDQPPLGQDHVGQIEARELELLRQRACQLPAVGELPDHPVVERPMVLELQRADRMGDVLQRVGDAVRVVVQRIDAPLAAGAMVRRVPDPVDRRIAHVDVRARHVDLQPQHVRTVGKLAGAHAAEELHVLGHRPVAEGTRASRLRQRAARRANLVRRLAVDVREAGADEPLGERVETIVVVGGMIAVRTPVESQPAHRLGDRVLELDVFLDRVGVVVAQVAATAVLGRKPEIEDDRLGVPVVEVAVRLGRKAGDDLPVVLAGPVVLGNDGTQEIRRVPNRRGPTAGAHRRWKRRRFLRRCSMLGHRGLFMNNRLRRGILTAGANGVIGRSPSENGGRPESRAG